MAGIGFELKKLFADKSVYGYSKAFSYSVMVTLGPFLLMMSMVLAIEALLKFFGQPFYIGELYVVSVIYPFIFSHILSSGFNILATRYISDKLYKKEYEDIVPSLYGIMTMACFCAAVPAFIFFFCVPLPFLLKILTFTFFLQMIMLWIIGVYLSALKDFSKIVRCYGLGVLTAVSCSAAVLAVNMPNTIAAVMLCMNCGIFLINILLLFEIKSCFSISNTNFFGFLPYFDSHGSLFLTNFLLTLGLYTPNFIFWFSPLQKTVANTYIYAPKYDTATFFAFSSAMAVMVMFVVITETNFYLKYARYFDYITNKGNAADIEMAKKEMIRTMWLEVRNIFEFQLVITLFFIIAGNYILPFVGMDYEEIAICQVLTAGAYASSLLQLLIILLLYFEDRRGALYICALFFILILVLNLISLELGSVSFGFGFFLSSFIILIIAVFRLDAYMKNIDYHIFCERPVYFRLHQGIFTKIYKKFFMELKNESLKN